jgi:U1 small nuclear ribonucleoprotein 70kDa
MLRSVTYWKAPLVVAALGGFLMLGGFSTAQARDRAQDCRTRVHKAEMRLDREIRKHGENSHQARHRREQLENARRDCRQYLDHGRRDRDRNHDRDHDRDRNHRQDRDHNHDHDNDHNNR